MTNEVLVTGAAGFIGRHVALAAAAAGRRVTTVDTRAAAADVVAHTDFRLVDQTDPAILDAVRAGRFAAVLHHAGISSTTEQDWSLLERVNVTGPLALASACAHAGTRFVYASSHSVYGRIARRVPVAEDAGPDLCSGPLNRYAKSKLLLDSGMANRVDRPPWIGLRYTNVFGTGEQHKGRMASIISQVLRQAAAGEVLRLFADTLQACRDYIPVGVVADACVQLVDAPVESGVYNFGTGHPVSFATLVQWCAEFSDTPIGLMLVPNPLSECYQFWTCADMSRLNAALPGRPVTTGEDVRLAARALFDEFQAGR